MFKVQNFLYILMWIINGFSFISAKRIEDIIIESHKKNIYKDKVSIILQIVQFIMVFCSIIFIVVTIFLSSEITNFIISFYLIFSFIDLIITGILETIFEGESRKS